MTDIAMTVLRRTLKALLAIALGLAVCAMLASTVAPFLGRTLYIVRGASMEPAIPLGSLVATAAVDPAAIAVGDIISFRSSSAAITTHRVVGIVDDGDELHLQTRGDANEGPDAALVQATAIVGRLDFFVPVAGYLSYYVSTPQGIASVLSGLVTLMLAIGVLEDVQEARSRRLTRGVRYPPTASPGWADPPLHAGTKPGSPLVRGWRNQLQG